MPEIVFKRRVPGEFTLPEGKEIDELIKKLNEVFNDSKAVISISFTDTSATVRTLKYNKYGLLIEVT